MASKKFWLLRIIGAVGSLLKNGYIGSGRKTETAGAIVEEMAKEENNG